MVDRERVDRLLARLADDIRTLHGYRSGSADLLGDATGLAAVKYHFITAVEGCARIAHHLISSESWPVAESNADAVRRLGQREVLASTTSSSLAAAVGFRNVLVHEYVEVDDAKVVAHLERLGDLDDFVREIAAWLSAQA